MEPYPNALFIWFGGSRPLTIESHITEQGAADLVIDVLSRLMPLLSPIEEASRAERMRENCAAWCEANGFPEAAPCLRELPLASPHTSIAQQVKDAEIPAAEAY